MDIELAEVDQLNKLLFRYFTAAWCSYVALMFYGFTV